ncbi:MAG TPA: hypothetical protein VGV13_14410 [Methylomirabilota bacterium]|jgi:hypothetical protein|nr:hypothetical protein [Methylomirabilota bacterium]
MTGGDDGQRRHAGGDLGRVDKGDGAGSAVTHVLDRRGGALYGDVETFFLGHRVTGGLALQRQRA